MMSKRRILTHALLRYATVHFCWILCPFMSKENEDVPVMENNKAISFSAPPTPDPVSHLPSSRAHVLPARRMQRFQRRPVPKREAPWRQAQPIPTSLFLQVSRPSSEHIQAWEMAKALRQTIFCCHAKSMLKVEPFFFFFFLVFWILPV